MLERQRSLGQAPGARSLLALVALALLAACGGGGDSNGGSDGEAYELVFDSIGSDGEARLYRSDLGATPPRSIWGGLRGIRPVADPTGSTLLFAAADPADPLSPSVLHQLDLGSGRLQRLSEDFAAAETEPSVAPDGRRIAFVSQREDAGGDIVVARWDSQGLTQRVNLTLQAPTEATPDRTPAWSPDGRLLAFTAYHGGGPAIWVMEANGLGLRRLTATGDWGDFSPSWSADGRTIAFQRGDKGEDGTLRTRIGLIDAAGGAPRFLELPHSAYDPRFSPDGRWLAFWARSADGGDICLAVPDGRVQRCFGTPGIDRHPAWLRKP